MMTSTFISLCLRLTGQTSSPCTPRRRALRPILESLEDRVAPSVTLTWTGNVSQLWSDPLNWKEGVTPYKVPSEEYQLIFPQDGVVNKVSVHDKPGKVVLDSITFDGSDYTMTGGDIEFFFANIKNMSTEGTNRIQNRSITVGNLYASSTWLQIQTLGTSSLIVSSDIRGGGGLIKTGEGKLTLTGSNSYVETTELREGTLDLGGSSAVSNGRLLLFGGTLQASTDVTIANDIEVGLSGRVTAPVIAGSNHLSMFGNIKILENTTLNIANSAGWDVSFYGVLSGPGGLAKTGAGILRLKGTNDNEYEGGTNIQAGTVRLGKDNALGRGPLKLSGGNLTNSIINANYPNFTVPNAFEVSGGSIDIQYGHYTFTGNGTILAGATFTIDVGLNGSVTLSGALLGEGGITKNGLGWLTFSGNLANIYQGVTRVNAGGLGLSKSNANAIPGRLIIGDDQGGPRSDQVLLTAPNQIADNAPVTVTSSGLLKLNDFNDKFGPLTGNGKVTTADPPTMTVSFDDILATFDGEVEGPGFVVKDGTGTWKLTGVNTYEGGTFVEGGTLLVDGSISSPVTVSNGATLGGTGSTGPVTLADGAAISPGGQAPGIQHVQALAFSSGSTYVVQLNGPDAGTGYDQLVVMSAVNLNGATLDASLGFAPEPGHEFVIIGNDGTDPVVGTLAGLPQGAVVWVGGTAFRIRYDGGDGNDVALVRNVPPSVSVPSESTAFQNVEQPIGGISVVDPDDASVAVALQVSHGTLSLVVGAGLTVVGNGTSSMSLFGGQAALNAALASLVYLPVHNYSGADSLLMSVSDGLESTSVSMVIRVKSLAEQAVDMRDQVKALQDAGVLNRGQAQSLLAKLSLKGNNGDIGRVQAFLNHVSAFISAGILSSEQGERLLGAGNILLIGLRRR